MEINNVKDLKEFLATLPAEADEWDVNFVSPEEDGGVSGIGFATVAQWDEEDLEDLGNPTKDFVCLACFDPTEKKTTNQETHD